MLVTVCDLCNKRFDIAASCTDEMSFSLQGKVTNTDTPHVKIAIVMSPADKCKGPNYGLVNKLADVCVPCYKRVLGHIGMWATDKSNN